MILRLVCQSLVPMWLGKYLVEAGWWIFFQWQSQIFWFVKCRHYHFLWYLYCFSHRTFWILHKHWAEAARSEHRHWHTVGGIWSWYKDGVVLWTLLALVLLWSLILVLSILAWQPRCQVACSYCTGRWYASCCIPWSRSGGEQPETPSRLESGCRTCRCTWWSRHRCHLDYHPHWYPWLTDVGSGSLVWSHLSGFRFHLGRKLLCFYTM